MLEGQDAIQRDLDRLEERDCVNFMTFNNTKCKGWSNPQSQHRQMDGWMDRWMDGQMDEWMDGKLCRGL